MYIFNEEEIYFEDVEVKELFYNKWIGFFVEVKYGLYYK